MRKSLLLSAFGCVLMSAFVNVSAVADVVKGVAFQTAEIPVGTKFSLDTTRIVGPPTVQPEVEVVEVTIVPAYYRFDGPLRIDKNHLVKV